MTASGVINVVSRIRSKAEPVDAQVMAYRAALHPEDRFLKLHPRVEDVELEEQQQRGSGRSPPTRGTRRSLVAVPGPLREEQQHDPGKSGKVGDQAQDIRNMHALLVRSRAPRPPARRGTNKYRVKS